MLEDVAGIRCVVLACDTVDLWKGIASLSMIIDSKYNKTLLKRETCSSFTEGEPIV